MQVDFHRTRIRLQTPRNKQKGFQRNSQRNKAGNRGQKRSWEPADLWEGRGNCMGHGMPHSSWGASAIQSEAGPTKSHFYRREIADRTETSPCSRLNRDRVRMGVVPDGKVGCMQRGRLGGWMVAAGGGLTSLYFIYFLPFRKPFRLYFSFLLAWDFSPVSVSKGGQLQLQPSSTLA